MKRSLYSRIEQSMPHSDPALAVLRVEGEGLLRDMKMLISRLSMKTVFALVSENPERDATFMDLLSPLSNKVQQ